ncbi:MAG: hypothetical protein DMF63_13380 [Acidobacteria bacterium]|nr:MAG: hypothetical protein DMF63_13380 [Acidobacteriota bacterium]
MNLRNILFLALCLLSLDVQPTFARSGQPAPVLPEKRDEAFQVIEQRIAQQTVEIQALTSEIERQKAEFEKLNNAKASFWNVYAVPSLPIIGAVFTAIGGWLVTYLLLQQNFKKQDKIRSDELKDKEKERRELYLVDALRYFEGQTQKRSIGIAFIEAYWNEVPSLKTTWTAVLSNQAIYILSKLLDEAKLESHELDNLNRISKLLQPELLQDSQVLQIGDVLRRFNGVETDLPGEEFRELGRWKVKYLPAWQKANESI